MEHLRDGIGLRGYGQRDPKQEYKKEGYDIFVTMMAATSSNVVTELFKTKKPQERELEQAEREMMEQHERELASMHTQHGSEVDGQEADDAAQPRASARPARPVARPQPAAEPVRRETPKIGRNDLCPCGSGEKFKKCHGAALEDPNAADADA